MKNFSLKTRKNSPLSSGKRSILKILIATIAAVLIVVLLRGAIGVLFSGVTTRIQAFRSYMETSGAALPSYVRDRTELHAEINRLRELLSTQSGSEATIARLVHENEELRALMGDSTDERILAGIIARPPAVPYDLLVLDRGSANGIKQGALVYYNATHALGVVSRVYESTSLVTLFSSAGAETTVYLYGPDIFAYAYGEGGGVIRISVPQGIELHEKEPVVLPSIHGGDLGLIERIVSLPSQPEQNAYVTFPVSIQSLRSVSVSTTVVDLKSYADLAPDIARIRERFRIEVPDSARLGTSTTTPTSTPGTTGTGTPPTQ